MSWKNTIIYYLSNCLNSEGIMEKITMDKVKLTDQQIDYIATHIEEEHAFIVGLRTAIENAIEAYNGGAR